MKPQSLNSDATGALAGLGAWRGVVSSLDEGTGLVEASRVCRNPGKGLVQASCVTLGSAGGSGGVLDNVCTVDLGSQENGCTISVRGAFGGGSTHGSTAGSSPEAALCPDEDRGGLPNGCANISSRTLAFE